MTDQRYAAAFEFEQIAQCIGAQFPIGREAGRAFRVKYFDTHDWRVHHAGATVSTCERGGERLVRLETVGRTIEAPLPGASPGFAWELPGGELRAALEPVLEARRLIELVEVEGRVQTLAVMDADDKTVARVHVERAFAKRICAARVALTAVCTVSPIRGYEKVVRPLCEHLLAERAILGYERGRLELALRAVGRCPGDFTSKLGLDLDVDTPATTGLAMVFSALLEGMTANVAGVRDNIDSEFLHDFRVAVRRTRSLLGQCKPVLDREPRSRFAAEFKWLGRITGPMRDLDVFGLGIAGYRADLPDEAGMDLAPLDEHIRRESDAEHRRLVERLGSRRFATLRNDWEAFLAQLSRPESTPLNRAPALVELASPRIWRAFSRVVDQGRVVNSDSPGEALHRLRIECKQLRYLLECFGSLYSVELIPPLVKRLRRLQDNLGDLNDLRVQQARLRHYAHELSRQEVAPVDCLLATGGLIGELSAREARERQRFAGCFEAFDTDSTRARFRELRRAGKKR